MAGSSAIIYRCGFLINREVHIWDSRSYLKKQHAYNRLELLKEEKDYYMKYGVGAWEVMYASGWKRENGKKTVGISTVRWVEEDGDGNELEDVGGEEYLQ